MELLYFWINKSYNEVYKKQGFNFSARHDFNLIKEKDKYILNYKEKSEYFEGFFDKENKIINITALVGKNGTGKTTLLKLLFDNDHLLPKRKIDDIRYTTYINDKYEKQKAVLIYEDNNVIKVYCNFDNINNETPFELILINDDIIPKLLEEDFSDLTTVYLTNSNYTHDDFKGFQVYKNLNKINLTISSLSTLARTFYIKTTRLEFPNDMYKRIQDFIVCVKDEKDFQQICDLKYFYYLFKNNKNESFQGKVSYDIRICFLSLQYFLEKFIDDFKAKEILNTINKFLKKLINFDFYNIFDILYLNLFFELSYYFGIDFNDGNFTSIKEVKDKILSIIKETTGSYSSINYNYFKNSFDEIMRVEELLKGCDKYESLLPKDDLGYKFGIKLSYDKKPEIYIKFISIIDELSKKDNSFIIKYLNVQNLYMSSGERAYLNFFSWLNLLPYFKAIDSSLPERLRNNVLLLIDEIDLYCHPEWQRSFIYVLIDELKKQFEDYKIQIIFATHSPLVLSDMPKAHTIFLKNDNGVCSVDDQENHKETFAANIYRLFSDSFFMKDKGEIGEFAKIKINSLIERINKGERSLEIEKEIEIIGEPLIKNRLIKLYNDISVKKTIDVLIEENDRLQKKLDELERKNK